MACEWRAVGHSSWAELSRGWERRLCSQPARVTCAAAVCWLQGGVSVLGSGSPSEKWDGKALSGEWFWPTTSTQDTHRKAPPSSFPSFLPAATTHQTLGVLRKGLQTNLELCSRTHLWPISFPFPSPGCSGHTPASSCLHSQLQWLKPPSANLSCAPTMCLTQLFRRKILIYYY